MKDRLVYGSGGLQSEIDPSNLDINLVFYICGTNSYPLWYQLGTCGMETFPDQSNMNIVIQVENAVSFDIEVQRHRRGFDMLVCCSFN